MGQTYLSELLSAWVSLSVCLNVHVLKLDRAAIGGVIALCLILAILGRGRYFITKFAKRSSSNDGRRHSRNSSIDSDAQMRDNHSNAPTLPDIGKASMDLAPEPLYYHSQHNRSNSSFHSRHSSRSRGLDFDMAQAPYHQPSYPPMPPAAPYRQHTFSEFGRGSGVSYAPSGSSQPWDDASSNAAGQGIPAAVPRPQPQRSSTMPISYNRPESTAWDAQPRLQIPSPRILTPSASPTIESPTMVYSPEAARASMRASVYDPFNRASVAASVYDPNMFHAH